MNYYKRYVGDYMRDTAHLSLAEHGAYTLLLDLHYANGQPLPSDRAKLYRMVRAIAPDEQAAADAVLDEFWTATPDGWVNGRAIAEMAAYQSHSETQAANARKRWDRNATAYATAEPLNDAAGMPPHSDGNALHSHSHKPLPEAKTTAIPPSGEARARATRWRDEDTVPTEWMQWAQDELGMTPAQTYEQRDRFVDHFLANGKTMKRWESAWRNWCRRSLTDFAPRPKSNGRPETSAERHTRRVMAFSEEHESGRSTDSPDLLPHGGDVREPMDEPT